MGGDLQTDRTQLLSSLAVLIGAAFWSIGMVYSRSAALHPDDSMAAAMSLLAGAVMLFVAGTVTGEAAKFDLALVSVKSLAALGYLAIAGSLIAYLAYFWLLNRFPPTLIATHTYVNPDRCVGSGLVYSRRGPHTSICIGRTSRYRCDCPRGPSVSGRRSAEDPRAAHGRSFSN
jgi:hypothetical protein